MWWYLLVTIFSGKYLNHAPKLRKNQHKNLENHVKSCKIMIFLSILKQFLLAHQAWACMTHAIKVLLLQVHVQLAGFCTCHYTSTCIQACTHTSTYTYCPYAYNHIKYAFVLVFKEASAYNFAPASIAAPAPKLMQASISVPPFLSLCLLSFQHAF